MFNGKFTKEDETSILEIARVALGDADIYENVADELDLSDNEMKSLQEKIIAVTDILHL